MIDRLSGVSPEVEKVIRLFDQRVIDELRNDYDDEDFVVLRWKQSMEDKVKAIKKNKRMLDELFASYQKRLFKVFAITVGILFVSELWSLWQEVSSIGGKALNWAYSYQSLSVPFIGGFIVAGAFNFYCAAHFVVIGAEGEGLRRAKPTPLPPGGWSSVVAEFYLPCTEKTEDTLVLSAKKLSRFLEREAGYRVSAVQLGQWLGREKIYKKTSTGWIVKPKHKVA